MSASGVAGPGANYTVTVRITGINLGDTVPLQITLSDNLVFRSAGSCTKLSPHQVVCDIAGNVSHLTSFTMTSERPPLQSASITLSLLPGADTPNDDTSNDSVTVEVPPLAAARGSVPSTRPTGSGLSLRR